MKGGERKDARKGGSEGFLSKLADFR